ncbi:Predicted arabinose efflux permease, MFS family [Roseomonas rosea]|uniref:Predicted arabinose efflux permease, MFS family n=1 Tax=Muricoccus roseus TaxID=198092 RepID=A0A1M6M6D2_9PROT|nr:MFS transporter [Roseomonas rosea]SHJ79027.1 Predicted arabinose efflux permease, MFS family [Roseomonas rosea]
MNDETREASLAFAAPLVALTLGHVLSNMVRTLPAIAADVLGRDLEVTAQGLASLTGTYNLTFALAQIPVGVALDRFGVRHTALGLLAVTAAGAVLAALAGGALGFLIAQLVLGLGCSGMLMCPVTYAAKRLSPARFGLWSGLVQALGNCGMLLSASPLALLVEAEGWRAGYWSAAVFGLLALLLVALLVREGPAAGSTRSLAADAREVLRLTVSPKLRGIVVLAFASFAAVIGVRGLWGGPWLMEVKGLPRVEAGNILLLATSAVVIGPALWGIVDRRIGHRRALLILGHLGAGLALCLTAMGAPGGPFGLLPPSWDAATLLGFFLLITVQPLAFAATRAAVPPDQAGKALAGVNLSFFAGAAVLQAASGAVVSAAGIAAGLIFLAAAVAACTLGYAALTRPGTMPR